MIIEKKLIISLIVCSLLCFVGIFLTIIINKELNSKSNNYEVIDNQAWCGTIDPFLGNEVGEELFKENCSSCHHYNRDLTGPS